MILVFISFSSLNLWEFSLHIIIVSTTARYAWLLFLCIAYIQTYVRCMFSTTCYEKNPNTINVTISQVRLCSSLSHSVVFFAYMITIVARVKVIPQLFLAFWSLLYISITEVSNLSNIMQISLIKIPKYFIVLPSGWLENLVEVRQISLFLPCVFHSACISIFQFYSQHRFQAFTITIIEK